MRTSKFAEMGSKIAAIWAARAFRITVLLWCICVLPELSAERPDPQPARKEIKVLGIGNSFTGNVFSLLQPMGERSDEHSLVLGHGIIGGCSMRKHITLAKLHESEPDNPEGRAYSLWVKGDDGERTRVKVGLKELLASQPWDIVTIQQLSRESTDIANYRPYAGQLLRYIQRYAPQAEVVMHQTWAYRADGDFDKVFPARKDYDQKAMYLDLNAAYHTMARELKVRLIPVGAAFQLAREARPYVPDTAFDRAQLRHPELPNDRDSLCVGWFWKSSDLSAEPTLSCDTHHAGTRGKYLAAAVWFEFLTGTNPYAKGIRVGNLPDEDAKFLSRIAHQVVREGKRPAVESAVETSAGTE